MESLEVGILSTLPRPRARRRQYFGSGRSDEYLEGGSGELSGDDFGERSAMSKRLKLSDLAKVVAQKAATSASKGVVISEGSETTSGKRALDDGSKGKQVAQSLEPKKARIDTGASRAPTKPPVASGAAGVILPTDKEKVDKLTFDQLVTKFIHALGQDADARSKVIAKLEERISELEKSQSLTQGRIIAAFKESDDFLEAVRGSASSYFGDGFDFCKRQLAHQYPDLGVDLEDVEMDHEFLAKEEAEAEQRAAEEGAAGAEGVERRRTYPRSHVDGELNAEWVVSAEKNGLMAGKWFNGAGTAVSYLGTRNVAVGCPVGEVLYRRNEPVSVVSTKLSKDGYLESYQGGCLYSLSPLPDSRWYYFKARPEKNLLRGSPSNVKGWQTRFFFASGDEWEFPSGTAASDTIRVPRSWGTPELQQVANSVRGGRQEDGNGPREDRARRLLRGVEGTGFADLPETLCGWLHSALYQWRRQHGLAREEGEFITREDSVEYLGVIRRDIGGVIRRAHPGIPDETLLRWLGGKVKDPFTNLLSGTSGSSSDSGSVSTSNSELPPELRSDAMSAGGKAKAEKATKTTAKPPTKGVVIREKRRAAEAGTSSPGGDMGSESMSDASVARRLLTGVIPASDKKEVDQLSENELVAKSFHALGQVVVFASSLALRSQEHLHDMDFHMARADSAELELVKAQNRALKAENKLAELNEERSKPGNEAAVTDSAASYFSEGFEFCKRQLIHQFPNLGVDVVANMAMDPSFAEEEEAVKEGEDPVAGVAPNGCESTFPSGSSNQVRPGRETLMTLPFDVARRSLFFSSRRSRLTLSSASLISLSKFETLKLGIPIFTGMTDSVPKIKEYGVSPVGIRLVDGTVGYFNLSISLRMTGRGEMMGDGEIRAEQSELVVVELPCVVRDDNLWDSESANKGTQNVYPHWANGQGLDIGTISPALENAKSCGSVLEAASLEFIPRQDPFLGDRQQFHPSMSDFSCAWRILIGDSNAWDG
ncbi:hypothetical protein Acr_07g0011750 [Actinidia rufa]|uniref:Uncharacterized protein n=1 Tax=Actinidia rufa TaxID=165716 RepID=A0A7J0EYD1_9ERIC|nr:hypothetical protein Acr_07g0011750 [Actinidia rufa]